MFSDEAVESLQSLERYTLLKAVDQSKRLVAKVMEGAKKHAGNNVLVERKHVQIAISEVVGELLKDAQPTSPIV